MEINKNHLVINSYHDNIDKESKFNYIFILKDWDKKFTNEEINFIEWNNGWSSHYKTTKIFTKDADLLDDSINQAREEEKNKKMN